MYYLSPPTRRQLRSSTLRSRLFTSSMLNATGNQSRAAAGAVARTTVQPSPKADSVHSVSPNRLKAPSVASSSSSCSACDRDRDRAESAADEGHATFFSASMLNDPRNQSITIEADDNEVVDQQHPEEQPEEISQQDVTMQASDDTTPPKPRQSRLDALDLTSSSLPKSITAALEASRKSGSIVGARFNDYQERLLVLELLRAEEIEAQSIMDQQQAAALYRDAGSESSRLARVVRSLQSTAVRARKPHTLYEHYSSRPTRLFPGDASEIHTGVLIPLNGIWPSLVPRISGQQLSLWLLLETDPSVAGVGMLVQSSLFLSNETSKKNCLEPLYCTELGYDTGVLHHKTVTSLKQHIKELDKMAKAYAEVINSLNEVSQNETTTAGFVVADEEEHKEASQTVKSKKRTRRSSRAAESASKKKRVLEPLQWEYFNETVLEHFESSPLFHYE